MVEHLKLIFIQGKSMDTTKNSDFFGRQRRSMDGGGAFIKYIGGLNFLHCTHSKSGLGKRNNYHDYFFIIN